MGPFYGEKFTISGGNITAQSALGDKEIEGQNLTISGGSLTVLNKNGIDLMPIKTNKVIITGGSVKSAGFYNQPTNGTENVHPLTIENPLQKEVYIDGEKFPMNVHSNSDNDLCVYLPESGRHTVQLGTDNPMIYRYIDGQFVLCGVVGEFLIAGGTYGADYSYDSDTLEILTDTKLCISNADPDTHTTNRIVISASNANLALSDVNINTSSGAALTIADSCT